MQAIGIKTRDHSSDQEFSYKHQSLSPRPFDAEAHKIALEAARIAGVGIDSCRR